MGNETPTAEDKEGALTSNSCGDSHCRVSEHSHPRLSDLQQLFSLCTKEPLNCIERAELVERDGGCCKATVLRVHSQPVQLTLDNLLVIKRSSKKDFTEREVWYLIKATAQMQAVLQANRVALGNISGSSFALSKGKFLKLRVLHLLPDNEHIRQFTLHSYYSPEFLYWLNHGEQFQEISLFKSEVFSFALLLLEVATCPAPKPKFHKHTLSELLWAHILRKVDEVRRKYSANLADLLEMMLREDPRTRPDWNYVKVWVGQKERQDIDVAPCIFWLI